MKVLLGYDGSECARRALDRAAALAGNDPVLVVSVAHSTGMALHASGAKVEKGEVQSHAENLREADELLTKAGAKAELRETLQAPVGEVAEALTHVAQESGVEMIVVGRRGMSGIKRLFAGSVSEGVVRHATCDVLVVH